MVFLFTVHMSLGALGDSFYEYLLKEYIRSGQTDNEARDMYVDAMSAIMQHMIVTSSNGLIYTSDMKFDRLEHKMDHLACFAGKNYVQRTFQFDYMGKMILYVLFAISNFRWIVRSGCQCNSKPTYRKVYGNWCRHYKHVP